MATPYTPTPNPLPATISLPQDVIDDVVVGTVNPQVAALADAIAYQNERINGAYLRATIDGGTYNSAPLGLTGVYEEGGIEVVSGSRVKVAEAGTYFFQMQFVARLDTVPSGDLYQMALLQVGPGVSWSRSFNFVETTTELFQATLSAIVPCGANSEFEFFPVAPNAGIDLILIAPTGGSNLVSVFRLK